MVHVEFHQRYNGNWSQDILGNLTVGESISLFKYIQKDASERLLPEDMVIFSTLFKNDSRSNLYTKIARVLSKKLSIHKAVLRSHDYNETFFMLYRDGMQNFVDFQKIYSALEKHNLLQ